MQEAATVTQINEQIKNLIEATFSHVMVQGEIGSVTYHTSGHVYFNIKDAQSSIKCVMFRSNARRLKFRLEKGQHIIISGSLGVYKPRGEYQLYAVNIEPYGQGSLAVAFEQLKKKLREAGYFENKKQVPKQIEHIAIVTSKSGAAIADMCKVIDKRWPMVKVSIIDTLVQGEGSAAEIAKHIAYADALKADVIIAGRGGGSVEDLWGFNEEVVAEAIYGAKTPVISAVGHEVDTTISDMVADLRAPTPSAAIEMLLPDKTEVLVILDEYMQRFNQAINHNLGQKKEQVRRLSEEFERYNPKRRLQTSLQEVSQLQNQYKRVMAQKMGGLEQSLEELQRHFKLSDPAEKVPKNSAFIVKEGKNSSLEALNKEDEFTLEDGRVQVQARCLEKKRL